MNKFSNKLIDCRSRLLDAEALLHHLHKPENLNNLLENCSPEVTLGAMIDKAWELVGNASGDCEALVDMHDDDVKAELRNTAVEIHEAIWKPEEANPANFHQHIEQSTRSMNGAGPCSTC